MIAITRIQRITLTPRTVLRGGREVYGLSCRWHKFNDFKYQPLHTAQTETLHSLGRSELPRTRSCVPRTTYIPARFYYYLFFSRTVVSLSCPTVLLTISLSRCRPLNKEIIVPAKWNRLQRDLASLAAEKSPRALARKVWIRDPLGHATRTVWQVLTHPRKQRRDTKKV